MTRKARIDMTQGSLYGNIFRFILPLILSNLLQQLYHAADMIIVGLSSDPNALGAIGSTTSYLSLIRNIFVGFSVGVSVVTARSIGAGNREETSRAAHTGLCMGALFGVLGGGIGILFARPVLVGMGYEGSLLTLALRYSYIYLACMPFLSLTNVLSAILHAKGDTKTSLYVLSGTGILNILLNLLLVLGFDMSVSGVAVATAVANLASAFLLWIYLAKNGEECAIHFAKLRMHRAQFGAIARIGFPSGIQSALFSLSNLIIQSSILEVNQLLKPPGAVYDPVIKGSAAAGSIENFLFAATNAISATASTVVAQNVGFGDFKRVRRSFWAVTVVSCSISLLMSLSFVLLHRPLLLLYGVPSIGDAVAEITYQAALTRILCKWTTFITYAFLSVGAGTLRGLGKSSTSAVISLIGTCAFRIAWIYTVFRAVKNLESIFLSYPISWILTGICFFIVVRIFLRRAEQKAKAIVAPPS